MLFCMRSEIILLIILSVLTFSIIGAFYLGINIKNSFENQAEQAQQQEQLENLTQEVSQENVTADNLTQQTTETEEENEQELVANSSLWCKSGSTVYVTSDIFGEGGTTKTTIGVETLILGANITNETFVCEACHSSLFYELTDRQVDEWTNAEQLRTLGRNIETEECGKIISSKTYLYTNTTASGNTTDVELIFSNKTLIKEFWHDEEGRLCLIINSILKAARGAKC